ncbi:hypothetical protein [Blastococcus sp. SYSU DS0539]
MPEDRTEPTAGASAAPAAADDATAGRETPGGRSGGTPKTWWLVAPAFVAGLFAGAILLGLLREDPPPVPATATEPPAPTGPAEPSPPGGAPETAGASAEITVNEACLRVVNGTSDLVDVIGDLGDAAAALDISGLDQAIRELQPLERRMRDDLDGCQTDTTLPGDLSPTTGDPEPSGTSAPPGTSAPASPSGSPTTADPPD